MNRIVCIVLFLLFAKSIFAQNVVDQFGAIVRSDMQQKNIYLCFTGHDFYEGFDEVLSVLKSQKTQASFFLTGDFVRNHTDLVKSIAEDGHYIGAHSDKHLLNCDWEKRDSLLFTKAEIKADIQLNLKALENLGIRPNYFMPPYEWYNQKVIEIATELIQITVNFSPGTKSNADYTTPEMPNYKSSNEILKSIFEYEKLNGMNGFHLLIHPGTSPLRKDKLYFHFDKIINELKEKDYKFKRF